MQDTVYDKCEAQIRGLESLGVVSGTYGGLLYPVLLQMIPDDLALAYACKTGSGYELKVLELIAFLHEFESREHAMHLTKAGKLAKTPSPLTTNVAWKIQKTSHQLQHVTQAAQTLLNTVYSVMAQVISQSCVQTIL